VPVARAVFDEYMPGKNQIQMPANWTSPITSENLLELPTGSITEAGLRRNIDVAVQYIESWLRGNGCVPIYNLMEDAATAEICRAQLWQWIRYGARLDDGRVITAELHDQILGEILDQTCAAMGDEAYAASKFDRAAELLERLTRGEFQEFLTTAAYSDFA
jgi:malate synthase